MSGLELLLKRGINDLDMNTQKKNMKKYMNTSKPDKTQVMKLDNQIRKKEKTATKFNFVRYRAMCILNQHFVDLRLIDCMIYFYTDWCLTSLSALK